MICNLLIFLNRNSIFANISFKYSFKYSACVGGGGNLLMREGQVYQRQPFHWFIIADEHRVKKLEVII